MSSAASPGSWPSRSSASWTGAAGAVNQRPGRPASWMPTLVPLRDISETMLAPVQPSVACDAHLAAAIVRLRKKWWFPATKRAQSSSPIAAIAGARSRMSRLPVAWLRVCSSSPMLRPCAARPNTSTGPRCSSRRASHGPSRSRKKRSRAIDSSSPTPNHSVRPGPSLSVEYARLPEPGASTTQTGMDGEQTPVIGPTWSCSFPGSRAISPPSSSRAACSRSDAQPSNSAAATQRAALRIADVGPLDRRARVQQHARSRGAGPPRRAGATVSARAPVPSIRSTAASFAAAIRSPCRPHSRVSRATASASPSAGGRQSTCTTGAPWSRRASANADSPTLTAATCAGSSGAAVTPLSALVQWPGWQISTRSPRRYARRPDCSASATSGVVSRLAAGIDGDDAALVPFGDGYLVICGEAISPPFLAAAPFAAGSAAVVTNIADVRAMGGRPLALVDMLVSPDEAHAEAVLDGIAWAARAARRPRRRRPRRRSGTRPRSRPRAPGRCGGRCAPREPERATCCSARSRSTAGTRATRATSSRRCATARRSSCARTARRSSRSPSEGSATRRATCRCPGSPARCCR